ncbi:tRNA pseudouridine(55) synthase TruB [Faecalicatena contorta]|uniref:tRNA pseudouridine synthase B n=1 Tax=Faecalicatena fissicatena TaxID=290055 RepID=A0ABS2E565_9FIRM|nr:MULTISPECIES: tRNA pseudouridine(55) synthase TruB [Faecalicatena]MBM6684271.1 tRNA pseudouridine(55) synthase TruB [Faecalicatena contorta]MBM6709417.1 tRNA pseudouridine(55) synthase TruB [Faecalicatena contorta]MBM6736776.1 tRNA pseudouridine(55) synthase TruB [Faecalicatena fissicatena]
MLDGIFNVYKEKGYTSHDVVARLRGIAGQKKVGHTGTLDPDAEGVLPVCLGKATKVCDVLTDKSKTYQAVLLLGRRTDTQDISGACLEERDTSGLAKETVRRAVESFLGDYMQTPPMYSALKVDGKKLYELAREGKTVERKARKVQIHRIEIRKVDLPRVWIEVECSKGTYIRTLCDDIGELLGVGGCMEELLRTRVGHFRIEDSVRLSELERYREEGTLEEHLIPVDSVFADCPRLDVPERLEPLLYNGNPLRLPEGEDGQLVRVYDSRGRFIALYRYQQKKHIYKNEKMFFSP